MNIRLLAPTGNLPNEDPKCHKTQVRLSVIVKLFDYYDKFTKELLVNGREYTLDVKIYFKINPHRDNSNCEEGEIDDVNINFL